MSFWIHKEEKKNLKMMMIFRHFLKFLMESVDFLMVNHPNKHQHRFQTFLYIVLKLLFPVKFRSLLRNFRIFSILLRPKKTHQKKHIKKTHQKNTSKKSSKKHIKKTHQKNPQKNTSKKQTKK